MSAAASPSRRDERRDLILDVARDCFLAEGYAATSMSTIAARLGGSKGTLYNYFPNKDELFAAMMRRQCAELYEQLFAVEHAATEPGERLRELGRAFLRLLLAPEALAIQRLVVAESGRFPELGRTFYESGPRMVMQKVGDYLAELMAQGTLRTAEPLVAAQHFKDLTVSGVYQQRLWGVIDDLTPAQSEQQIERAVGAFLRAYAPEA